MESAFFAGISEFVASLPSFPPDDALAAFQKDPRFFQYFFVPFFHRSIVCPFPSLFSSSLQLDRFHVSPISVAVTCNVSTSPEFPPLPRGFPLASLHSLARPSFPPFPPLFEIFPPTALPSSRLLHAPRKPRGTPRFPPNRRPRFFLGNDGSRGTGRIGAGRTKLRAERHLRRL